MEVAHFILSQKSWCFQKALADKRIERFSLYILILE